MATISLNEIISVLASRTGVKFSRPLMEELKTIVNYKRANYTQQFLEKHPEQRRFFQQSFTTDLEKVAPGDCNMPDLECDVLRTKCDIPTPIRSSITLFDFVGSGDWKQSWGETRPEFNSLNKYNKYTSKKTKWFFLNNKIYLFNNLTHKKLSVRSVFTDPYMINSCCSDPQKCFTDDSPYPIAADILNAIMRDILNVELRNVFPQPGVVGVSENKDTDKPMVS